MLSNDRVLLYGFFSLFANISYFHCLSACIIIIIVVIIIMICSEEGNKDAFSSFSADFMCTYQFFRVRVDSSMQGVEAVLRKGGKSEDLGFQAEKSDFIQLVQSQKTPTLKDWLNSWFGSIKLNLKLNSFWLNSVLPVYNFSFLIKYLKCQIFAKSQYLDLTLV